MDISEEQASSILDFLARRAGFSYFAIDPCTNILVRPAFIAEHKSKLETCPINFVHLHIPSDILFSKDTSKKTILLDMLSDQNSIKCTSYHRLDDNSSIWQCTKVFKPSDTIESLAIQADLQANDRQQHI